MQNYHWRFGIVQLKKSGFPFKIIHILLPTINRKSTDSLPLNAVIRYLTAVCKVFVGLTSISPLRSSSISQGKHTAGTQEMTAELNCINS